MSACPGGLSNCNSVSNKFGANFTDELLLPSLFYDYHYELILNICVWFTENRISSSRWSFAEEAWERSSRAEDDKARAHLGDFQIRSPVPAIAVFFQTKIWHFWKIIRCCAYEGYRLLWLISFFSYYAQRDLWINESNLIRYNKQNLYFEINKYAYSGHVGDNRIPRMLRSIAWRELDWFWLLLRVVLTTCTGSCVVVHLYEPSWWTLSYWGISSQMQFS